MTPEAHEALRAPFKPDQIGKLPRAGIQLDYVGHAVVTDRLLEVDPEWTWEPVAFAEDGGPLIRYEQQNAVLWIRLTVAGTTRLGVGIVGAKSFELEKQLISDAIRNGAMRFGVALDLWAKEGLGGSGADAPPPAALDNVDAMKPKALNEALAERNLEQGGTVTEMRTRLREYEAAQAAAEFVGAIPSEATTPAEGGPNSSDDGSKGGEPGPDVDNPGSAEQRLPSPPTAVIPDTPMDYLALDVDA